jgi:Arc/MetJ-type ribon-helix-helix transcriptional regulator
VENGGVAMATAKIAVSIEQGTLKRLDRLVQEGTFRNRSRAIQEAVDERLARITRERLARECAKLDPEEERRLAEEGMESEAQEWPEY